MRRLARPLAATLVLAGCMPQPPSAPTPAYTAPRAATPAPHVADWRDLPPTPGTWTYTRDARGSLALFGPAGSDALLSLRCDRAGRQVYLARAGTAAAPLTIRTTSSTRTLAVRPTGGTPPYAALALAPADPILDAMGFSRGRFVVEQAGTATLAVPAWAEIERIAEDCRG